MSMHENWIDRLSEAPRAALRAAMVPRRFDRGALIYGRTEAPQGLYVIRAGSALFCLEGVGGRRLLLKILRENELFGETVAFDGRPAPVSIEARSELFAEMIPASRLGALRAAYPEIDQALARVAMANLRAVLDILEEQALLSLAERTIQRLAILCREDQEVGKGERTGYVRLHISQSDLAAALGASRQAVNSVLAELEASALVQRGFRWIDCNLTRLGQSSRYSIP